MKHHHECPDLGVENSTNQRLTRHKKIMAFPRRWTAQNMARDETNWSQQSPRMFSTTEGGVTAKMAHSPLVMFSSNKKCPPSFVQF